MSKRYREVLEEVETPQTRAASRAADQASCASTEVTAGEVTAGEVMAGEVTAGEVMAGPAVVGVDGDGSDDGSGGVATLVRPTAVAAAPSPDPRAARAAPRPDPRPGSRSDHRGPGHRAPRPGNGPADATEPLAFAWRGRRYEVTRILGHWREEEGWWRRPDGEPIRIEQSDLWRVEATRGTGSGVYELARRGTTWRLDRVWD